jgi:hypothetical protein
MSEIAAVKSRRDVASSRGRAAEVPPGSAIDVTARFGEATPHAMPAVQGSALLDHVRLDPWIHCAVTCCWPRGS